MIESSHTNNLSIKRLVTAEVEKKDPFLFDPSLSIDQQDLSDQFINFKTAIGTKQSTTLGTPVTWLTSISNLMIEKPVIQLTEKETAHYINVLESAIVNPRWHTDILSSLSLLFPANKEIRQKLTEFVPKIESSLIILSAKSNIFSTMKIQDDQEKLNNSVLFLRTMNDGIFPPEDEFPYYLETFKKVKKDFFDSEDYTSVAKNTVGMRLLFPKKSPKQYLTSYEIESLIYEFQQRIEGAKSPRHRHVSYTLFGFDIKLITAKELKFTEKGLEIISHKNDFTKTHTPSLPNRRNF